MTDEKPGWVPASSLGLGGLPAAAIAKRTGVGKFEVIIPTPPRQSYLANARHVAMSLPELKSNEDVFAFLKVYLGDSFKGWLAWLIAQAEEER